MLSPLLVIGVGGSGGKTIRAMKQALRRRLDRKGYEGPLPSAWQFLQIDTVHDGLNFPAPMLPAEEVHVVVPPGADYPLVRSMLESFAGLETKQRELLTGWTVSNSAVAIKEGAGMLRGIGRSVGAADFRGMFDALQGAASRLSSPTASSELQAVARTLDISGEVKTTPRAMLITSLSGGSGAGMFLDVAELLKYTGTETWRNELLSFLFTPEVFAGLGAGAGDVNKNALGALNEIVAGNWAEATPVTNEFLAKQGLPAGSMVRKFLGSKGNVLIGATNSEGVDISKGGDGLGMDEVFLTVGETLAGLFVDPDTIEALYTQILVNVTEKPIIVDRSGLSAIRTEQVEAGNKVALPFAGFGFARLTLGVDRAVDFVADAFTRAQVRRLLWPEGPREQAPPAGYTRQQWATERVDQLWPDFLSRSGVNERGSDDQVINALRPAQWKQAAQAAATKVVQAAVSEKPRELTQVAALTWNAWGSESKDVFDALRLQVNSACQAWVAAVQISLRAQVADVLSAEGFNVALGLVDKLASEIRDGGAASLAKEAAEFQSAFNGVNTSSWQSMVQEAAGGVAGLSAQNTDALNKLREKIFRALEFQVEALVRDLGSRLLADLAENFVAPLRASLADSRGELVRQASQEVLDNGQKNPLGSFPDWSGLVPQRYRPRSIERTLVRPEEYQGLYESYALQDRQMPDPFGTSFGLALRGQPLRADEQVEQTLVAASRPWVPQVPEARNVGDPASKAMFAIASELLRRGELNRRWLTDRHSSFGKMAQQSIADFVHAGGDVQLQRERQLRFADAYAEMMKISQPLVKLNSGAMQQLVTGADDGLTPTRPQLHTTKIPFAADEGVIGQRCTAAWKSIGEDIADAGFEAKHFKPGSTVDEITTITATAGAYPAYAFASLTAPIAKAAATCVNDTELWMKFWQHRRTRPLMEAIPLPRPAVRSVITGWFIAKAFDMLVEEPGQQGPKLTLWNPTLSTPGRSAFPYPLLMASSGDALRKWWLPSVLQSIGLAMVDIGQTGRQEPAHPYLLLQYLGREVTTVIAGTDTWTTPFGDRLPNGNTAMCDLLSNWMQTGEIAVNGVWGSFTPTVRWTSPEAGDFTSRKSQLLARISEVEAYHTNQWAEVEQMHWVVIPHYFELRAEISQALASVKQFVEQSVHASAVGTDMA